MTLQSPEIVLTGVALAAGLIMTVVVSIQLFLARQAAFERERLHLVSQINERRANLEAEIYALQRRLESTAASWNDVNHLVAAPQRKPLDGGDQSGEHRRFLKQFAIEDVKTDPDLAFVLMPFSDEMLPLYKEVKSICSRMGLNCRRGDEDSAPGDILASIVRQIAAARVVLAFIDGRKLVILIASGSGLRDVPFNVSTNRIVVYETSGELEDRLRDALGSALRTVPA